MKDYLQELVNRSDSALQGRNIVREYLQARILESLQRAGAMVPLAFHGGTALRFLYRVPRWSEDLGFALERNSDQYDFRAYLRSVESTFRSEGYALSIKVSDQKVVDSAFIRFPGLLFELGLSPHLSQVLAVKVEVDTRPPAGAGLETTMVRRHVILHLQHHDRPSLLAGKLHAILQRNYVKGRDFYDLFWYLTDPDWPEPNLPLLRNALEQTNWTGPPLEAHTWRHIVALLVRDTRWKQVEQDLMPFLPAPQQFLFSKKALLDLLDSV